MRTHRLVLGVALLAVLAGLATPGLKAAPATTVTVEIDDLGPWTGFYNVDPLAFRASGIRLASDYVVGFSNGHAVLSGWASNTPPFMIAASFTRPVSSVSASIRMHVQGTADYTLTAYAASGKLIGSSTITLSQDGLDGNFYTVSLDNLPIKAKSFTLLGGLDYGVKSISYSYGQS
jgi:hypothetical protein